MKAKVELNDFGDILTFEDVSLLLKIKRTFCYYLFKNKIIKGFKLGREWRIRKSDLLDYIANEIEKEQQTKE